MYQIQRKEIHRELRLEIHSWNSRTFKLYIPPIIHSLMQFHFHVLKSFKRKKNDAVYFGCFIQFHDDLSAARYCPRAVLGDVRKHQCL